MTRRLSTALVLVAVLGLTGCQVQPPEFSANEQVPAEDRTEAAGSTEGGGGGGGGGGNTLEFVAVDIAFDQAPTEVTAGEYTVILRNEGAAQHNVVFDDISEEPIVEANGGETAEGTVTLEPGEYRYHCSIPGHESLMNGTLTVS
ncbi:MAG TPA: plastocyanin/azurin family copper-binding protein [Egibacteraceae bacterium]